MTRENEMILKVLETQFKKDAKEAHEYVEALGYEIFKYNGSFCVKNPKTGKKVHIEDERYLFIGRKSIYGIYWGKNNGRLQKIDYVNFLEKPENKEYYRVANPSKYEEYKEMLKDAKWGVEYHEKQLKEEREEVEAQMKRIIDRLTRNIEYHNNELGRAQERLNRVRKEIHR